MVFLKPEENSADGVGEADVVVTVVLLLEEGEGKAETVEEKRGVVAVEVDEGEDCGWLVGCNKNQNRGSFFWRDGRVWLVDCKEICVVYLPMKPAQS